MQLIDEIYSCIMTQLKLCSFLLLVTLVWSQLFFETTAAPKRKLSTKDQKAIDALYTKGMVEGDILVRKIFKPKKVSYLPKFRNAVRSDEFIYPNGIIPYQIDEDLSTENDLIERAMAQIMKYTCIRFRKKTSNDRYYVRIFKGKGCYSSIGRDPDFPEGLISLGDGCYYIGTVVHELMHTIGYYHEHNRHDRDEYLNIYPQNINPDDIDQFTLNDHNNERIFTAFDYNSVMLYGKRAFSKDGTSITMEPKLPGFYMIEVHEKPGLTKLDAESINKLYHCPS